MKIEERIYTRITQSRRVGSYSLVKTETEVAERRPSWGQPNENTVQIHNLWIVDIIQSSQDKHKIMKVWKRWGVFDERYRVVRWQSASTNGLIFMFKRSTLLRSIKPRGTKKCR